MSQIKEKIAVMSYNKVKDIKSGGNFIITPITAKLYKL